MMRRAFASALVLASIAALGPSMRAGGRLEQIDVTGDVPSPIAGHVIGRLVGIEWDARALPVAYSMNTSLATVPNPLGASFLPVADASATLQQALDSWNAIPTSFVEMRITGTTSNAGLRGFDFVNELTFRTAAGFTAIASSPSTSLIRDVTLVDGDDIDLDGDSDVSDDISATADVDGDGDIEFPAGFYRAGTILDNDVQFNTKVSNGLRFTVADADVDTVTRSVDLECVAVHEFGHSFGLSHVMENQKSAADGTGATMFPFIDTGDPAAELGGRSLDSDDIAWASYLYPEGSGSGIAALQAGDVRFDNVYGLITGDVRHGVLNQPIAGASVSAHDRNRNEVVAAAYSGTTQVSVAPNGGLFIIDAAFNILDGRYTIPAPKGNYDLRVEALDGNPAAAGNISLTAQIGAILGQQNFHEELYNNNKEADLERRAGDGKNVSLNPGKTRSGVDITTNATLSINNFGTRDFIGFTGSPAGRMYAVRFPKADLEAVAPGEQIFLQAAQFDTSVVDASVPVVFARALLVSGSVDPATGAIASLNLDDPMASAENFLGQDNDFAPFFFKDSKNLGRDIRRGIERGEIEDVFLVLQIPTTAPFPGVSQVPPLIGLDGGVAVNDAPIHGLSYTSDDGGATWTRSATFNFRFSLVFTRPPQ